MDIFNTNIDLITILTAISLIVLILAHADKACENVYKGWNKGWNVVSLMASSAKEKANLCSTHIKQLLAYTATSPPVNFSITPQCGALRINADVTVKLTGGTIRCSGGRLILA